MYRYTCLAVMILLLVSQLDAACNHIDNQDLIEYSCEGGSINDLKQIPSNAEKIRISNMTVSRISNDLFSRFGSNLVVLTCSHCLITDIDDEAFRSLENLQQLSLDNNHLKEVKGDWFEGLVYLTYLDLNYNGIERIDNDVFRNVPDIVDLRLSGNRLLCLDLESMSRLHDLKRMFLNDNPSFGCPNAMKKFLNERNIDYEADTHWSTIVEDRIPAREPVPPIPPASINPMDSILIIASPSTSLIPSSKTQSPTLPSSLSSLWPNTQSPYYMRVTTETPSWSMATPTANLSPRPPYIREMINPSVPEQGFTYQSPYYVPEVTQQQIDNYKNTVAEQIERNKSAYIATTMTTTTECSNAASRFSRDLFLLIALVLTSTLFFG